MSEIPNHKEDHDFIKTLIAESEERKQQWRKIMWSIILTGTIGVLTTLFAIIGYAAKAFVDMGGQ